MEPELRSRRDRVRRFLDGARVLKDPSHALGAAVRQALVPTTGLSPENIECCLTECLEVDASDDEVTALCQCTPVAPAAHVLLSANVFVAALRAIAIAISSSQTVLVRPSRRDPVLTHFLAEACPSAFTVVDQLHPNSGDHVWLYGRDQTLSQLSGSFVPGVVVHPHGAGFGLVACEATESGDESSGGESSGGENSGGESGGGPDKLAEAIAKDVALFDQRGCLSPRLVLVLGTSKETKSWAERLAAALALVERSIPRGRLLKEEQADIVRYRDTMLYSGSLIAAGSGWVGVDTNGGAPVLAPTGRVLHVCQIDELSHALLPLVSGITTMGIIGRPPVWRELSSLAPRARLVPAGRMQHPPLDGPVDRRGE